MYPASDIAIRELDRRTHDRLDVRLLWKPKTNRVYVAVEDERCGESFEFEVDRAKARDAFIHPYAYRSARTRTMGSPLDGMVAPKHHLQAQRLNEGQ